MLNIRMSQTPIEGSPKRRATGLAAPVGNDQDCFPEFPGCFTPLKVPPAGIFPRPP